MGLLNIRKGNDIRVLFTIMDGDNPYDITGATGFTVSVVPVNYTGYAMPVSDLDTSVNPLMFTIKGTDTLNVPKDPYRVVVSFIKDGGMVTLDAVAFELVNYSACAGETTKGTCPNVQAETVSLAGQVQFATASGASIVAYTYDPATRVMTITQDDGSTYSVTLPQASDAADGLMTTADVATISDLVNKVQSLVEGGVWRATFPTYADMEAAHPGLDVSGTNWFGNDFVFVLADETHDGAETSYIVTDDGTAKTLVFRKTEATPISQATNTSLGVLKGDANNTPGKMYAESDGSMSLIGYDDITESLSGAVMLAGTQTITGAKTFAVSPSVPTPTINTAPANKGYVDGIVGNINSILDNINGQVF
jgi:hypothetical protein